MSKWLDVRAAALCGLLMLMGSAQAQTPTEKYPGLGRSATAREIAAWDIDVRADFKGLPKGERIGLALEPHLTRHEHQHRGGHGAHGRLNGGRRVYRGGRVVHLRDTRRGGAIRGGRAAKDLCHDGVAHNFSHNGGC